MRATTRSLTLALAAGGAALGLAAAPAAAAPPAGAGSPQSTVLTPEAEVAPFEGVAGASGEAALRLNSGQERICVDVSTEGFDLQLLHVHEAPAGQNGPVVVDLTPLVDPESGTAVGCVDVERGLVKEIRKAPEHYYLNAHEGAPPSDGFFDSIRGQLG